MDCPQGTGVIVALIPPTAKYKNSDVLANGSVAGGLTVESRPIWRLVLLLALPVLGQQFLIMLVGQSDRFLAGNFEPVGPQQQAEALGHHLIALGLVAGNLPAQGTAGVLAAEASWEAVRQLTASQVA